MPSSRPKQILVIRRDNIGDLVCTTPLLRALRRQLPGARIEVLVTRYNQAVLQRSPDIDELHFYVKAKHRNAGESVLGLYWQRLRLLMKLRHKRFDLVLVAGGMSSSAMRLARTINPSRIEVLGDAEAESGAHEVERCCRLLDKIGLSYETPSPRVLAEQAEVARQRESLGLHPSQRLIGVHVSARKPSQRWPADSFVSLIAKIHEADPGAHFQLLWAPGSEKSATHPGDDEKARTVMQACGNGFPLHPQPTDTLERLIVALAACDVVICADGGAMHLAAGLGKPIVCFFGNSSAERWHPWGVPYELLQKPSKEVADISVEEAYLAYQRLEKGNKP